MMPIPIGSEPTPRYVSISPESAAKTRSRCLAVGTALIVLGAVLGLIALVAGLGIPQHVGPFLLVMVMSTVAGLCLFLTGVGVLGARFRVSGTQVNEAGMGVLRRLVTAMAAATVVCAVLAVVLSLPVISTADETRQGLLQAYLAWPITAGVLAIGGWLITRGALRPR